MTQMERFILMSDNTKKEEKNKLEHQYPTPRGISGNIAKVIFLLMTDVTTKFSCQGRENFPKNNPYVVASNHQCFADGVLIAKYLPKGHFKWMCALVASDLETDYGWLGRLIVRVGRGIAVDRFGNPVRGLIKAKKEVENGNICFVFPEGTRCDHGKLGEMKDGAAYIAIKANVPMVPIYISGAYQIWPKGQKWPKPWKAPFKRRKLVIHVGEPLRGEDYDNDPHKLTAAYAEWEHKMEDMYFDPEK